MWGWSAQGGPHLIESSKQHMDFYLIFLAPIIYGRQEEEEEEGAKGGRGGGPGFRGRGGDVPF